LSPNVADNIGSDNTTVFSGDLLQPRVFGDTLHITLTTPFSYDSGGDIALDTNGFNNGGLDGNMIMGRVITDGSIIVNSGGGRVEESCRRRYHGAMRIAPEIVAGAAIRVPSAGFVR
jgi:hypothetical protein